MLTIILCGMIVTVALVLIGRLVIKDIEWYELFWTGFVGIIAFLQIWSIFLPVNNYALITTSGFAIISLFFISRKGILSKTVKFVKQNFLFMVFGFLTLFITSYYASQSVSWGDTLLYHLNAVKWSNFYAVVPGLGNLHSRLGFNDSFFLFAALLNNWIMQDRASHLALFTLSGVLCMEFLWIFLTSRDRFAKLFCLFVIPFLFINIAKNEIIASLSPDFACSILVLAASVEIIKGTRKSLIVAGLLALVLITVKFSAIVFSVLILGLVFYKFVFTGKERIWKPLVIFIGISLLLMVPFLIRGIYLTGWPLFPLPFLGVNVDWALPKNVTQGVYIVASAWAKNPGPGWVHLVGAPFWTWFPEWYLRNRQDLEVILFFFAIIISLAALIMGCIRKAYLKTKGNIFVLGLVAFANVLYVFFTAPDTRFGGIYVWVFLAVVLAVYFGFLKWSRNTKHVLIVGMLCFTFLVSWPLSIDTEPILKSVRWDQTQPTKKVTLTNTDGSTFVVLIPLEYYCGNSDVPCTPELGNIVQRVPGDMSKGFRQVK